MRHCERSPNLVWVLVLMLVSVALTFELRDGAALEMPPPQQVSFGQPPTVVEREEFFAAAEPVTPGGYTVHCPVACLHAPVVRPRADHLWLLAMLIAGLSIFPFGVPVRPGRPAAHRRIVAAPGAVILLHLCVCRC